ncbi:MAG: hypothetical protein QE484_15890 [Rhizobium sp.]|nr:hypothetical protein [Rhizobium sp.]
MNNRNMEKIQYHAMPTATSREIVEVYGDIQFKVQAPEGEDQTLLSEVRHFQWQGFEMFSATHLTETRISIRHSDDIIAFLLPSDGQAEVLLRSRRILRSNGAIAVPRSHCREIKFEAGKRQLRLGIPSRRFHKHIQAIHGQAFETSIKFDETPKLDARMLDCLVGMIDAVFHDVGTSHLSGALLAHRIEALEICLLAVWPNNLWHNNIDSAARIAPRHVRSAIATIRADPFTTFNIPALAEACDVSVRTLQNGFRQFTSFSISEFITQSRLSIMQSKVCDPEYIESVRSRIGLSAFKNLNLEHRIIYGRNILDR